MTAVYFPQFINTEVLLAEIIADDLQRGMVNGIPLDLVPDFIALTVALIHCDIQSVCQSPAGLDPCGLGLIWIQHVQHSPCIITGDVRDQRITQITISQLVQPPLCDWGHTHLYTRVQVHQRL